uniref:Phosphoribosylformimino-5-aminoimidazole carboxamide ribotide isomerase n=1 Tax=Nelumbo nucifera TaxID=4432 RepID=A0A822ZVL6_NELNU|nr:TPA_asm: hypothetical protein HUJ06_018477 [Nelumbo nucifera]
MMNALSMSRRISLVSQEKCLATSRLLPLGHYPVWVGKVKQIVGSTLRDLKEDKSSLITNFESDKSAAEYANLYKQDGLTGGHVIMLGADALSISAAIEALHAYPGGLQVGGGINSDNALSYLEEGASHVIVTSYVFKDGQMDLERLKDLVRIIGKQRLVLDLSCRRKVCKFYL